MGNDGSKKQGGPPPKKMDIMDAIIELKMSSKQF